MAELVVGRALLRVFQGVVGLINFLEGLFSLGIAGVTVGVMLHGQLTESRLQLLVRRGLGDTQNVVVIAL